MVFLPKSCAIFIALIFLTCFTFQYTGAQAIISVSPQEITAASGSQATVTYNMIVSPATCGAIEFLPSGNSCITPTGLNQFQNFNPSSCGVSSSTNLPECSGGNPGSPCILATSNEVCSGTTCTTVNTVGESPIGLNPGTYTFCAYGGNSQSTGSPLTYTIAGTNTVNVVPPLVVGGAMWIAPPALNGYSYVLPSASANISLTVSGFSGETASSFDDDIYVVYISNSTQPKPASDFPCPATLADVNAHISPQGKFYNPCTASRYSNSISCYTQFPVLASSCDSAGDTCTIFNFTPPDLASGYSYNICAYYDPPDALLTSANVVGNALLAVTSNSAYSYGLGFIPASGAAGSSLPAAMTPTSQFVPFQAGYPGEICNLANGDVCSIEYAGLQGSAYPIDQCIGYQENPVTNAWVPLNSNYGGNCTVTTGGTYLGSKPILQPYANDPGFLYNNIFCALNNNRIYYQNQANNTYTQQFNTQYLPDGSYLLCGYDFMKPPAFLGSNPKFPYYSPFFTVGYVTCQYGTCVLQSAAPPPEIPTCTLSVNGGPSTCGLGALSGGEVGAFPVGTGQINAFQSTVCSVYGTLNGILLIFALVLMLLGAAIYAGSSLLPAQGRGMLRSYAFGFVMVGVISAVIASVSIWLLSVAGGVPIANVVALCS